LTVRISSVPAWILPWLQWTFVELENADEYISICLGEGQNRLKIIIFNPGITVVSFYKDPVYRDNIAENCQNLRFRILVHWSVQY
jgi:hypothetical protein